VDSNVFPRYVLAPMTSTADVRLMPANEPKLAPAGAATVALARTRARLPFDARTPTGRTPEKAVAANIFRVYV
jgi:hypothetical protein